MSGTVGRITTGIELNEAIAKTIDFVEACLPSWRDDPDRDIAANSEPALNSRLVKFLNATAREQFPMVFFHHEEPQASRRSVDLSAQPTSRGAVQGTTYNKYTPFLVIECKRLPTPGTAREREYVTSTDGNFIGGGIQRFKHGLHGGNLTWCAMIGYVQTHDAAHWAVLVNGWIDDLANGPDPLWSSDDALGTPATNSMARTARLESQHLRMTAVTTRVRLTHLWVEM